MQPIDLKDFQASCSEKEPDPPRAQPVTKSGVPSSTSVVDAMNDCSEAFGVMVDAPIPARYGLKPPMVELQQEKFEHRVIAHLKAAGHTNKEIADMTGYTAPAINYIVKQAWMEPLVLELIHQNGGDKVEMFISEQALPACQTLAEIMTDEDSSNRDKIAAARELLNRKYGNPTQPITVHDRRYDPKDLTDDELARIAKSGSTRTASTPDSEK